jgi:hypothetical protein
MGFSMLGMESDTHADKFISAQQLAFSRLEQRIASSFAAMAAGITCCISN